MWKCINVMHSKRLSALHAACFKWLRDRQTGKEEADIQASDRQRQDRQANRQTNSQQTDRSNRPYRQADRSRD